MPGHHAHHGADGGAGAGAGHVDHAGSGASIAPDPVTGVLLAGVVYPVVFGAVGGALANAV